MKRRQVSELADSRVPPQLLDADAPVWHDRAAYLAFMAVRGWSLPPQERFGASSSPANRRTVAAAGWASDAGVVRHGFPDWHRLRAMGLIAAAGE